MSLHYLGKHETQKLPFQLSCIPCLENNGALACYLKHSSTNISVLFWDTLYGIIEVTRRIGLCWKNMHISTDFLWQVFHILTELVPHTFVSDEITKPHCMCMGRASLFRWFTDTNVCGTGSVKIRKTPHKISVDIRICFTVWSSIIGSQCCARRRHIKTLINAAENSS